MRITFGAFPAAPVGTVAVGLWRGRRPTAPVAAVDLDGGLRRRLKRLDFDGDEG